MTFFEGTLIFRLKAFDFWWGWIIFLWGELILLGCFLILLWLHICRSFRKLKGKEYIIASEKNEIDARF